MNRCSIIGCGLIAGGYDNTDDSKIRTHAKAFVNHPDCTLVGVSDRNENVASDFSKKWSVPFYSNNPNELLRQTKPDILSICTPTESHEEIFNLACSMGVKNIWLEKPAAQSIDAVRRMQALSKSTGTNVWINYFRRYDPGFNMVKSRIKELGKIRNVQAVYTKGTRHNGSHMLDVMFWFFGDVTYVRVKEILRDSNYDSVSAELKTDIANIELVALDYNAYELFEVDILADLGRIRIIDGGQKIIFENVIKDKYYKGYKNLNVEKIHEGSYEKFMANGLSIALNGKEMPGFKNELSLNLLLDKLEM
jgi:predicted dehydrogenase